MKIYHNPRCQKSRETLEMIVDEGIRPEVIEYLKHPLNKQEIAALITKLKVKPEELIRKGEVVYKEKYQGKKMSDSSWIKAMVENPILIERPIVEINNAAIIGRPPENVKKLF